MMFAGNKSFQAVYVKYDNKSSALHSSIIRSSRFAGMFHKESKKAFPSMSLVSDALQDEDISEAVMKDFALSKFKLPEFPDALLYGLISERIHSPDLAKIIVSDKADNDYKSFFTWLGQLLRLSYAEFNENARSG